MTGTSLQVERLDLNYGDRPALKGVSFVCRTGELVALAGPNGSGKTSLLRAIAGMERLSEGKVSLHGRDLGSLRLVERAREVAWMPQEELPGDDVPVEDYVRYGRNPYEGGLLPHRDHDPSAVDRAMVAAGCSDLRDRTMWKISGGERQRVRLARVLSQECPLVLLDEPTSHLDIGHQLDVLTRVRELARRSDRSVLVALHDLNLAARFADRILVLTRGQLGADGAPDDVLSPDLFRRVWGIDAELRRDAKSHIPYLLPQRASGPVLRPSGPSPRVHVVAGGGSGREVLRALSEEGFDLTTGALPLFDSDSELAEALRVECAFEVPFAPVSQATRERLRALLRTRQAIVVAAFPVGPTNLANLEEVARLHGDRPVLLLKHEPGRSWDYTLGEAARLRDQILHDGGVEVESVAELLHHLRALPGDAPDLGGRAMNETPSTGVPTPPSPNVSPELGTRGRDPPRPS